MFKNIVRNKKIVLNIDTFAKLFLVRKMMYIETNLRQNIEEMLMVIFKDVLC